MHKGQKDNFEQGICIGIIGNEFLNSEEQIYLKTSWLSKLEN